MSTEALSAPAFAPGRAVTALAVPVGHSNDRVLPYVAWLAQVWGLPIRLLHASGSISSDDAELATVQAAIRGRWRDLDVEAEHLFGDDPAVAVAGAVEPHDLPVLSTEHADAWSFKSSVAEAVVDRVGVPLVLVGPHAGPPLVDGEVVVALDGTKVADTALGVAAALAGALGKHLWLVRVVAEPDPQEGELHPELGLDLQRLTDGLGRELEARWEVIHSNDPVRAVEGFADRVGASFVVAATRGRTDATRTTMCSITMGLVSAAKRPVLVVHADRVGQLTE